MSTLGRISLGTFCFPQKSLISSPPQIPGDSVRKLVVFRISENYFIASLQFPQNVIIHHPTSEATGKARESLHNHLVSMVQQSCDTPGNNVVRFIQTSQIERHVQLRWIQWVEFHLERSVFLKNHSSRNFQGYLETLYTNRWYPKHIKHYLIASLPHNVIIHNSTSEATGKAREFLRNHLVSVIQRSCDAPGNDVVKFTDFTIVEQTTCIETTALYKIRF